MANKTNTTNTATTRFNFNSMRPVILDAWKAGNKKLIKADDVAAAGLPEAYYNWYVEQLVALYNACTEVATLQHDFSKALDEKALAEKTNKAFSLWKQVLENVEPERDSKVIRCNAADVNDLVAFCWKFVSDANNVSESKDFVAHKVYGSDTKNNFRKKVEIMLGNMAAESTQMDSWKVRYLREESKLLGKIRKNRKAADEAAKTIAVLTEQLKDASDEVTKTLKPMLDNANNTKSNADKNVADFTKKLADLHADPKKYVPEDDRMTGEKAAAAE